MNAMFIFARCSFMDEDWEERSAFGARRSVLVDWRLAVVALFLPIILCLLLTLRP